MTSQPIEDRSKITNSRLPWAFIPWIVHLMRVSNPGFVVRAGPRGKWSDPVLNPTGELRDLNKMAQTGFIALDRIPLDSHWQSHAIALEHWVSFCGTDEDKAARAEWRHGRWSKQ